MVTDLPNTCNVVLQLCNKSNLLVSRGVLVRVARTANRELLFTLLCFLLFPTVIIILLSCVSPCYTSVRIPLSSFSAFLLTFASFLSTLWFFIRVGAILVFHQIV